jgi:hypothetical protein
MKLVTDLFDPEPMQWGLRGDPWVWRAMQEHLTGTYLPPLIGEVESLLYAAFDRVVGVELATATEPWIYREQFVQGDGLSDGNVHLDSWRTIFLPLLLERAGARISG